MAGRPDVQASNITEPHLLGGFFVCGGPGCSCACYCCQLPWPAVAAEEGEEPVPPPGAALDEATKAMQLEGLFLFAMVWSVGATCDAAGRTQFDHFFR